MFSLLQTELSDTKETITDLNKRLFDTEAKLTQPKQIKDEMQAQQVKQLPVYYIVYDNHKCHNTVTV